MEKTLPNEQPSPDPVKILAVDDDPQILQLLQTAITSFGYHCTTAADGGEALEKLTVNGFAILLTDMTMPRMDGMTLLKKAKDLHPQLDVIVITGYAETFSYTEVIRAGACDFITKPFNIDELEAKLRRALREQELVRKLEQLSMRDSLTELYNFRGFERKLREEATRARRQAYPLYLAIIDLDKFKEYNDRHGHQAGDEALKGIARLLLANTRTDVDWCCRQGGDEFTLILPYASTDQAAAVCQRILEEYRKAPWGRITLSCGLAHLEHQPQQPLEEALSALISRADAAMYRAKAAGGDQLVIAS
ncbi:MAG: diguanylate cyclase [Desulfurivibrio sp.]|nr:diguanylate cyclase [Desulfurivibrio sp.]